MVLSNWDTVAVYIGFRLSGSTLGMVPYENLLLTNYVFEEHHTFKNDKIPNHEWCISYLMHCFKNSNIKIL